MVESDGFSSSPTLPPPAEQEHPPKEWGVTKPLSHAGPTDVDIQRTKDLEKVSFPSISNIGFPNKEQLLVYWNSHEMALSFCWFLVFG